MSYWTAFFIGMLVGIVGCFVVLMLIAYFAYNDEEGLEDTEDHYEDGFWTTRGPVTDEQLRELVRASSRADENVAKGVVAPSPTKSSEDV